MRLGTPHDIVGPYLPPILRRFDKAWPRVRVSLKCTTTPQLLELLRRGNIDLTLTTEQRCGAGGKTLLEDDLVWAGAANGAPPTTSSSPARVVPKGLHAFDAGDRGQIVLRGGDVLTGSTCQRLGCLGIGSGTSNEREDRTLQRSPG